MSIYERFGNTREQIEKHNEAARSFIEKKSIIKATEEIEKSKNLLIELKNIARSHDEPEPTVSRLTSELEYLAIKIDELLSKREAGKKEGGNIAFKCNWNDKFYKEPCSLKAYEFNIHEGRAWCSSPLSKCREFIGEPTLDKHPCYESIALKEMYFGAGWDHTKDRVQPRHIHSAKVSRLAILTSRPPEAEEKDRLIIGCLYIKSVQDDHNEETKIYGDRTRSFEIDYNKIKVKFWDYYKNEGAEDLILWASGLFRYVSDGTVFSILKGIVKQYEHNGLDITKIDELIRHYEVLINKK
ncbi:MAG: hypothetical protein FD156_2796 [Nitrospirae bacterium]|nr:MAG: hypothetical protein FD156_2796 [Nitrospirota bacterium]